jgi:hypothetical protein
MSVLDGLFTTPEDVRKKQQQAIKAMMLTNPSMARGMMTARGAAGMMGLKTDEEREAMKLQELLKSTSMQDPQSLLALAKRLNERGNTRQAIAIADRARTLQQAIDQKQRQATQDAQAAEDRAFRLSDAEWERNHRTQNVFESVKVPVYGKDGTLLGYKSEQRQVTEHWNPETQEWERRQATPSAGGGSDLGQEVILMQNALNKKFGLPETPVDVERLDPLTGKPVRTVEESEQIVGTDAGKPHGPLASLPPKLLSKMIVKYSDYSKKMAAAHKKPMPMKEWILQQLAAAKAK